MFWKASVAFVFASFWGINANMGKFHFAPPGKNRPDKQNCYMMKVKESAWDRKYDLFDKMEGDGGELWELTKTIMKCNCRLEQLKQLADDDDVLYLEEDSLVFGDFAQATGTSYWNLDRVDQAALPLDNTYNYQYTGQGVPIYILDTGVNGAHEEFAGRMGQGTDIVTAGGDPNVDCNGHGTHVAGIAAGTRSGVAKLATVVSVRVLGCDGSGTMSGIASGINWATTQSRGVINLSLGGSVSTTANDAVAAAVAQDFVVVVAAGNENTDACTKSPASAPNAITVAAVGNTDQRSSYSNYGNCVDIFAPGDNILSASNTVNNGYVLKAGTSMATPMVSGAAAVYWSGNPSLSGEQLATVIENEATSNAVSDPMGSPNLILKATGIPNLNSRSPSVSPVSGSPSPSPVSSSPSPVGPSNDQCSNALELPCNSAVQGSTTLATFNGSPMTCNTTHTAPDVWYYINVPAGAITLSMCNAANFDTKLTLWGGSCNAGDLSGLQCIIGGDDTSGCSFTTTLTKTVTAGRYLVMVHGYKTSTGNFNLTLQCPNVLSPSPSSSPLRSRSPSPTPLPTPSPKPSNSPSASPSSRATPSPSPMGSPSQSPNSSPSISPPTSGSSSPSTRPTPSGQPSASLSTSSSPSSSPSTTPGSSPTPSASTSSPPSSSESPADPPNPQSTPSASNILMPSTSPLPSPSPSPSPAASLSPSPAASRSTSPMASRSPSPAASLSPSPAASRSTSPMASRSPSPAASPSAGLKASPSPSPKVKGGKTRGTSASMYDIGLTDWGYPIGTLSQITSFSNAKLTALASTIDDTVQVSYLEGFHAHVVTQQSPHFVMTILGQADITVSVSSWGPRVAKAVVTSFNAAASTSKSLGLPQSNDPYVMLCQVDRLTEDGQLANDEPLVLTAAVAGGTPLEVSLHSPDQRSGVEITSAGGYLTPNSDGTGVTIYVPHTSLVAIRAPLAINIPEGASPSSSGAPFLWLLLLLTIAPVVGIVAGTVFYLRRRSARAELACSPFSPLWDSSPSQCQSAGSAAPESSPSHRYNRFDFSPMIIDEGLASPSSIPHIPQTEV